MTSSSSDSESNKEVEDEWTGNEGETTDEEEAAPAHASLRGCACLVTAACPRKYPRDADARKRHKTTIPEDFRKAEFLRVLRQVIGSHATVTVQKATCHDEPHKRMRPSCNRRERHKHVALLMSGCFAHKKVADAFYRKTGLRISFSFKLFNFCGRSGKC